MPLTLNKVHEFAVIQGQAQPQLVAEHHYVRLKGEGADFPLYIQGGQVCAEGGPEIPPDELPAWFWTEVRKCTPQSLAAAGWQGELNDPDEPSSHRRR